MPRRRLEDTEVAGCHCGERKSVRPSCCRRLAGSSRPRLPMCWAAATAASTAVSYVPMVTPPSPLRSGCLHPDVYPSRTSLIQPQPHRRRGVGPSSPSPRRSCRRRRAHARRLRLSLACARVRDRRLIRRRGAWRMPSDSTTTARTPPPSPPPSPCVTPRYPGRPSTPSARPPALGRRRRARLLRRRLVGRLHLLQLVREGDRRVDRRLVARSSSLYSATNTAPFARTTRRTPRSPSVSHRWRVIVSAATTGAVAKPRRRAR